MSSKKKLIEARAYVGLKFEKVLSSLEKTRYQDHEATGHVALIGKK